MDQVAERDVLVPERRERIARIIEEQGRARVATLAGMFGVSEVTIRKDLATLQAEGRLRRAHGGAVAAVNGNPERAFEIRERLQHVEKDRIGLLAASLVQDGESIALDASTTALAMARHLRARGGWAQLTVITNGLRIASELAGSPGITVVLPGGFLRPEAMSVVGPLGEGMFERVNIQRAFLGAVGFTLDTGLSDATEEEAQIKRLMVRAARDVVALVDHTKWGRAAFATFCPLVGIRGVVTDDAAPRPMIEELRRSSVAVHVADQSRPGDDAPSTRS